MECPYSQVVWSRIGMNSRNIAELLIDEISMGKLEVKESIFSLLCFSKMMPPKLLLSIVIEAYTNGLCRIKSVVRFAKTC